MDSLTMPSPAKVNLRLEVLWKRKDGYHELKTIIQRIDLCDTLEISLVVGEGLHVSCEGEGAPQGVDNIVYHAAKSILDRYNKNVGIRIFIKKRIPLAAGLGGGSSNAATTLMALNKLLGLGLTKNELMRMGTQLGADVPFFILEKPALATGIGDRLKEIELPSPIWMVLINPKISVSTAWVYKNLNIRLTRKGNNINMLPLRLAISDLADFLHNDLETVTIKEYPEIQGIKEQLVNKGATGSLMSGSGPTVFGIFPNKKTADKAFHELSCANPAYTLFLSSSFDNINQGGINGSNGS